MGHIWVNEDDHCDKCRVTEWVTSVLARMITVINNE